MTDPLQASPSDAAHLDVGLLEPSEAEAWDAFVRSRSDATPYHLLAWSAVTEEGLGHRPLHLRALSASGAIAGVLPLFEVTGIFGRRLVSVPMRDRGGVLATDPTVASALIARAIELMTERRSRYIELKSLEPLPGPVVAKHGLTVSTGWITTRVDLAPGAEALWRGLDRNAVRWAINNARRNGVRAEASTEATAIDTFYALFERTRRGLGIPVFPKRLFQAIHRHMITQGQASLVLVYRDQTPINALISVHLGDTFLPAYAAPQKEWRKSYPSEIAFWHTIEWAASNGFRYYDFGADSEHQEGLLRFKKKWGGVPQRMSFYQRAGPRGSIPHFDSSSPRYALARRVWSRLPGPVGRVLGGWVTRQLS